MSLSSMTGFARAAGSDVEFSWQWELRSVNSKSLDMRLRLPPGHEHLEVNVRTAIGGSVKRGSIQASLAVDSVNAESDVVINESVLSRVVSRARELQMELDGPPMRAEALLALRGVIEAPQQQLAEDQRQSLDAAILATLAEATRDLVTMRNDEGRRLETVLQAQINEVSELSQAVRHHPARTAEAIKERLRLQVQRLLDTGTALDPDRLHQEALLLLTRNDVQEELDRLDSHIAAARELLQSKEPIGRKFDFLSQEFNREANTICSKANDKNITGLGLALKTIIDQMREQIQNIE